MIFVGSGDTSRNLVWDVNTLTWVKETQPTGGGGGGGTVDQGVAGASPWLVSVDGVPHVVVDSATLGTVAISAASLPLPSGASTGTKQDSANTTLASIDAKVPALGQALAAGSVPVVLPAATVTTLTPPAAITGFATATRQDTLQTAIDAIKLDVDKIPSSPATAGNQTTTNSSLASIDGKVPALGQALAAASVPIVLTALQVSALTPPAAITGYATSSKQDTGNTSLASLDGKAPALGQALAAGSVPVILPAATIATLTPPAALTGFATSTKQDTLQTAIDALNGKTTAVDTGAVVVASSALPSNAAKETGGNLATLVTQTAPLVSAQGDSATGVLGPLVQGRVTESPAASSTDETITPLSLTLQGRLRVTSPTDEQSSVWGRSPAPFAFIDTSPFTSASPWDN